MTKMLKIKYILIIILLFLIYVCGSCSVLNIEYTTIKAGIFEQYYIRYITIVKDNVYYDVPLYEDNKTLEDWPLFNFKFKLIIEEITEEEFKKANGLNVIRDYASKSNKKYYSIEVLIGYSLDTLEQVDFIYSYVEPGPFYEYIYDRGLLYFGSPESSSVNSSLDGSEIYISSQVSIDVYSNKEYNNSCILDDLVKEQGYDSLYISFWY